MASKTFSLVAPFAAGAFAIWCLWLGLASEIRDVRGTSRSALRWIAELTPALEAAQQRPVVQVPETIEERVIVLPEDGQSYHLTLVVHQDWQQRQQERSLVGWFELDARLRALKAQVHFHFYTTADAWYQQRFIKGVPPQELPAVMLQQADGKVIYKVSSSRLPATARTLADTIQDCFPRPRPVPLPQPQPLPEPDINPIPDLGPEPLEPSDEEAPFPWLMLAASTLLGGGLSLAANYRREKP